MPEAFAVVCSWCNLLVKAAPEGTLVTHTICPDCIARTIASSFERPSPSRALPESGLLPLDFSDDATKR